MKKSVLYLLTALFILALNVDLLAETVTLNWLEDESSEKYVLEVATDEEFNYVIQRIETAENHYNLQINRVGTFYIRVAGSYRNLLGPWSIIKVIEIENALLQAIDNPNYYYYLGLQYYYYGDPTYAAAFFNKANERYTEMQLGMGFSQNNLMHYNPPFITEPQVVIINEKEYQVGNPQYYLLNPAIKNTLSYEMLEIQQWIQQDKKQEAIQRLITIIELAPFYRPALQTIISLYNAIGKTDMAAYYQERLNTMSYYERGRQ